MSFWSSHVRWSQRYGIDDAFGRHMSLILVFLVLIFVYPLKMVFASFFNAVSRGYLPANFSVNAYSDIPAMFITFAVAFGSMGLVMAILYWHAWRKRVDLKLSYNETQETKISILRWLWIPVFAALSFALAVLIPATPESGWLIGMPGFIYFGQNILQPLTRRYLRKRWLRNE
jgi:mannose/fructose/N-acetylgalactosamine-specific phosphotransferase system component IIC